MSHGILIEISVHQSRGSLSGVTVHFVGVDVPTLGPWATRQCQATDAEGRYDVADMRPGKWETCIFLRSGQVITLPDLLIPDHSLQQVVKDLRLPGGIVTGALFDRRSGREFGEVGLKWNVYLLDTSLDKSVSVIQEQTGARFELPGIGAGRYRLCVNADGYQDYRSSAFSFSGIGTRDFGRIELDQCGVLDLEVLDPAGNAVAEFVVVCNGTTLPKYRRKPLSDTRYRLDQLPFEDVELEVSADGFAPVKQTVTVTAGEPVVVRIFLDSLQ